MTTTEDETELQNCSVPCETVFTPADDSESLTEKIYVFVSPSMKEEITALGNNYGLKPSSLARTLLVTAVKKDKRDEPIF